MTGASMVTLPPSRPWVEPPSASDASLPSPARTIPSTTTRLFARNVIEAPGRVSRRPAAIFEEVDAPASSAPVITISSSLSRIKSADAVTVTPDGIAIREQTTCPDSVVSWLGTNGVAAARDNCGAVAITTRAITNTALW
jgi:hypothetical protein